MAPIYGISLFIQVEFVGSGFADPCLFHGVNLLPFIYKSNKPASNIISTWTLQRKYQTGPIPPIPSPRLPSKFHNQTSTKGSAAQSMARRAEVGASVLEIDPPCLLSVS